MFTKLVRFAAVLLVIGLIGAPGAVRAAPGRPSPFDTALSSTTTTALGVQFLHVATAANISSYVTLIDHPLINDDSTAIIFVTPHWGPGGTLGVYSDRPIGVMYVSGQWSIFNQDLSNMPANAAFNVIVPQPGSNVFVHTATASTIPSLGPHRTIIDHPLTNGNPNARILVTPRYQNASGSCPCVYNNNPIGVWYNGTRWEIFNQNFAAMPVNASFNVFVIPADYAGAFVHTATSENISAHVTTIDFSLINNNPNALLFVTPNWNPGGVGGTYNNHNIGVYYASGRWRIFNQDAGTMLTNAAFNVLVLVPQSDVFVHKATAANSDENVTLITHTLTNDNPNAIIFVTPNWNPGGVGGTYNNHNIGVYYDAIDLKWAIFNQDVATMGVNTAFNVLIPHPDASVFVHRATSENISGNITVLDYPLTNHKPNAIILVTPNFNPGGVGGVENNRPIGVYYFADKWRIFNQNGADMPNSAAFNVIVPRPGPGEAVFVHTATVTNTTGHITSLDHPLTNGNPHAIVLVTPNWNPGGFGGTYNNHPIGVYYDPLARKWAIFNQDLESMLTNAAFNVYVKANRVYLPLVVRQY